MDLNLKIFFNFINLIINLILFKYFNSKFTYSFKYVIYQFISGL